jgi:hypothetical protein
MFEFGVLVGGDRKNNTQHGREQVSTDKKTIIQKGNNDLK